ncbi:hypothetical protein [Tateyamaria sp. Alg231-49]|uniref:hypothetical protein n=1 Tax=Tateyamaria sp. Alg231-49 TaxID=1922219 RepID=UPI000D54E826|nr:hypothetical protein [Tateyamaria sp. Alg231-49]
MPKSRAKLRKSKTANPPPEPTRRSMLKLAGGGVLAAAGAGGVGLWAVGSFRAYAAEHDLTRVGQGDIAIVQIHDPQCPTCTALQKQTRAALRDFDDCGVTYLVADITTPDGAAFARKHRVSHVTLLLFDGAGELHETAQGLQQASQLAQTFAAHKAAVG